MTHSFKHALCYVPLAAYLLFLVGFAANNPLYTWDTVPYTASILADDRPESLHERTYAYLASALPASSYGALVAGPYASDLERSAEHFATQLPMYSVKPAYIGLLRGLNQLGADPLDALLILSLVPGVLICLLMALWLRRYADPLHTSLIVVLFAIAARLTDLSRVPVPDNLSALAILAALFMLIELRWTKAAVGLLVFSVSIRTNNILFVGLVLAWQAWTGFAASRSVRSADFLFYASALVLGSGVYFAISNAYDYQWWRLFTHTFIQSQVDISTFTAPFSLTEYWEVVSRAALRTVANGATLATALPFFVMLLILTLSGSWTQLRTEILTPSPRPSLLPITALCLPVFGAFFLLFPLVTGWDRFYVPFYALITILATQNRAKSL